ncbi:MAG: hypothetical protein FJW20_21015 [Acidimicrobiia bacterium]|nr:hypothetical protein [Acidimicrobiia bacterium]
MRRLLFVMLFVSLAGSALYLNGQPNSVRKITDGVWFREGDLLDVATVLPPHMSGAGAGEAARQPEAIIRLNKLPRRRA